VVEYTYENPDYTDWCGFALCEHRSGEAYLKLASGALVWIPHDEDAISYGSLEVSSKPIQIQFNSEWYYDEYGNITHQCGPAIDQYNLLSSEPCFQYSIDTYVSCSYVILNIDVRPSLPLTGSATGDYCENQTLTLSNTSGFTPVQWQYRVSSGAWQDFNPGSDTSVTFGIQNIFGAGYPSYLNQPIYFRYSYSGGGCDPAANISNVLGPYTFSATRPLVTNSVIQPPSCKDYTDAVIKLTSLNRTVLSGETLTYTVYTPSDVFVAQHSSTQQPSLAGPIELRGDDGSVAPFGIAPGNYKILVESNL
jgi:hypothetical protein